MRYRPGFVAEELHFLVNYLVLVAGVALFKAATVYQISKTSN